MSEHRYILEPYKGTNTRHTCPACGHRNEFALYIDTATGKPVHPLAGRCNRTEKCGYHRTPSDIFREHPDARPSDGWAPQVQAKEPPVSYLPSSLIGKDSHREENNLFRFMVRVFGREGTVKAFDAYRVGTSRHWRNHGGLSTVFPQIDTEGRLRQLKVMAYNPETGKRMKKDDRAELWDERKGRYADDVRQMDRIWFAGKSVMRNYEANFRQTFFGTHLIGGSDKIGLLESEKSALICSILMPEATWIATGGCNGCRWTETAVFSPLIGKRVVLYPDSGMCEKWEEKADLLRSAGVDATVSRICDGLPGNWDVADVLIREHRSERSMTVGEILEYARELGIANRVKCNI